MNYNKKTVKDVDVRGKKVLLRCDFNVPQDKETAGLPEWLREKYRDRCIRIPMKDEARSLNLSNSVAILAYEALRQQGFPGLLGVGSMGG